jgi:hypothetical protein
MEGTGNWNIFLHVAFELFLRSADRQRLDVLCLHLALQGCNTITTNTNRLGIDTRPPRAQQTCTQVFLGPYIYNEALFLALGIPFFRSLNYSLSLRQRIRHIIRSRHTQKLRWWYIG